MKIKDGIEYISSCGLVVEIAAQKHKKLIVFFLISRVKRGREEGRGPETEADLITRKRVIR